MVWPKVMAGVGGAAGGPGGAGWAGAGCAGAGCAEAESGKPRLTSESIPGIAAKAIDEIMVWPIWRRVKRGLRLLFTYVLSYSGSHAYIHSINGWSRFRALCLRVLEYPPKRAWLNSFYSKEPTKPRRRIKFFLRHCATVINDFTQACLQDVCKNSVIDWMLLVSFNSSYVTR
jgi:hypothetical protein